MTSALSSSFGLKKQSAKGTAQTTGYSYLRTVGMDINPDQRSAPLPQELGGALFVPNAHFKQGVIVGGSVDMVVRPDYIGYLLYGLTGSAVLKDTSASPVIAHTFELSQATDGTELPWFTVVRNVSDLISERFTDMRVASLRLAFPTAGIATARFGLLGITPETIAAITGETFDNTPVLTTCSGTVTIPGLGTNVRVLDFALDFTNGIDPGGYYIGSYVVDDLPVLARACTVNFTVRLKNDTLYKNIYYNGGSAFSGTIYQGTSLSVKVQSASMVSGTTPYSLEVSIPQADYLVAPIALAPGGIVTLAVAATVTLPSSGKAVTFKLTNGSNTAYDA